MPPKPPFDISTTRSPGRRSFAMPATMSSIDSASRACCPQPFKARTSCGTESRSAAGDADDFQPPLDARERAQPVGNPPDADPHFGRNGDRRQRVAHVVRADQRQLERAEWRAAPPNTKPRRLALRHEIVRLPLDVI